MTVLTTFRPVQSRNASPYDEDALVELTPAKIAELKSEELADIIRMIRGSMLRDEVRARLHLYDRETLERMVHLTRRHCQEQRAMCARVANDKAPTGPSRIFRSRIAASNLDLGGQ